ncbi:Cell pattern formation-associated protein stuA [Abortiporus biennis]
MQAASRVPGQQAPVKIYNAVYSSVQVYECMVRGIAVMRRRADSYVNATQILKVAGVDKGRRTKILEKEVLPGKHEIVQGGYGKYQGTWIPLERGRDIAAQFGVGTILAPLFDFVPHTNTLGGLPSNIPNMAGLAPPPIMPGSALRLLNQGRAQGLFTPSTSVPPGPRPPGFSSPSPYFSNYPQSPFSHMPGVSPTPPPPNQNALKRTRSEADVDSNHAIAGPSSLQGSQSYPSVLAAAPDIQSLDRSRPTSMSGTPQPTDIDRPSPTKRARTEPSPFLDSAAATVSSHNDNRPPSLPLPAPRASTPSVANGVSRPASSQSVIPNGRLLREASFDADSQTARFASKPSVPRNMDPAAPARDTRRATIILAICQRDDPSPVLDHLREISPDNPAVPTFDVDLVLDEQGHTALHLAASMARHHIVEALIANGADVHRGNYNGETPLIRACLATQNADAQTFHTLVAALHQSIRTLDTSRKSVLHHIVASAGVKNRAIAAHYYLEQVFLWIAQHQNGDFRSIIDLQDEHGDTALNIAARVGNRSLVRMLLDVGANRILPNKLGLRPGDFGIETDILGGPRADDILGSLRGVTTAPVQKSQDVLTDIEAMIHQLSADFANEIKNKQENYEITQAHVRAATRELAEQRKQKEQWQARCAELDIINQRAKNLEKALADEDNFDWAGPMPEGGENALMVNINGTTAGVDGTSENSSIDVQPGLDSDPAIPVSDSVQSLIRLRRMKAWHARMEKLMDERLKSLKGASAEKEFQCKKIVSLCTGVPMDRVEDMLENLVIAVESEASIIDISRVSGFMQKVRNGVI